MIFKASMNNKRLRELIRERTTDMLEDQLGFWKFEFNEVLVLVITDESHNRMRIMSPVVELASMPDEQWEILMSANFDRALDARYCANEDTLWSAFIHPLEQLDARLFHNALEQVVTLAQNYGSSYSSGELTFGG